MLKAFKRGGLIATILAATVPAAPSGAAGMFPHEATLPGRSAIYSATGPAIVRIRDGRTIELTVIASAADIDRLEWTQRYVLDEPSYVHGWRLRQILCDTEQPSECLLERQMSGISEWSTLNLADAGIQVEWRQMAPGRVFDYDASSKTVLRLDIIGGTVTSLVSDALDDQSPAHPIWWADPANSNAYARFLPRREGERPILLMTGGLIAHWQVIDNQVRSPQRPAPGEFNAALSDTLYFSASSSDGEESWLGYSATPAAGADWNPVLLAYHGAGAAPRPATNGNDGRLWQDSKATAFLSDGTLLAVTQRAPLLNLSEICRRAPGLQAEAHPIAAFQSWTNSSAALTIHGGAPGSQAAIVMRTGIGGRVSVKALIAVPRDEPAEAIGICGRSKLRMVDLPLPDQPAALDTLEMETHTAVSQDGTPVTYDVIGKPGRTGQIMIRPYGAYGLAPAKYLTRRLEQDWVAKGNRLVVPHLRGDAGPQEWVEGGRGDYKARTTADLIAVAQDLKDREPGQVRIDLVGISAGGFVAAKAAFARPDLFGHIVLVSAVLDLSVTQAQYEGNFDRAEFGSPEGRFEAWFGGDRAATEGAPAFIVLHGTADEIVPVQSTANFVTYARALGYSVKGQSYQNVGHELADAPYILTDAEALY